MCEMLWNDPQEEVGMSPNKRGEAAAERSRDVRAHPPRLRARPSAPHPPRPPPPVTRPPGVGVAFGPDVSKRFLERNELQMVVRSHEVKEEGFEVAHDGYCITVFSAPNYCDQVRVCLRG